MKYNSLSNANIKSCTCAAHDSAPLMLLEKIFKDLERAAWNCAVSNPTHFSHADCVSLRGRELGMSQTIMVFKNPWNKKNVLEEPTLSFKN